MGVIKVSWSTPTLALPHPEGEGILDRVKSTLVWKPLAFKAKVV